MHLIIPSWRWDDDRMKAAPAKDGVTLPDGEAGAQLAHLVRVGCTLAPDAYLFTVIDRAILSEASRSPAQ